MRHLRLGCLPLRVGPRNFLRKRFAVCPYRAIREVLLLPYWDRPLQRVDQPTTCVKGGSPVGGKDRDQHAAFSNFDPPQPMYDRDIADREPPKGLGRKAP